ncbi:MAG: hypothetical protein JNN15_02355 [Blastocatellia bacterium]|nr:hypothetical protein [Blastocatellia bacterium]
MKTLQALEVVVTKEFNYYNYFTEVEEAFVSRRGAPMLISPLDWALIESWRSMGIPLHIVLRGINKSFESYNLEPTRTKRVNTLFYCQQEVLSNFKDYVNSQIGANNPPTKPSASPTPSTTSNQTASKPDEGDFFPKQELIGYISSRCRELEQARKSSSDKGFANLQDALWRTITRLADISAELSQSSTINTEALEKDLSLLEDMIYENLRKDISQDQLNQLYEEAEHQLRPHKKRMEKEVYVQTLENFVAKRLREIYLIPRLSLFYML